jgi:hypothetical protein
MSRRTMVALAIVAGCAGHGADGTGEVVTADLGPGDPGPRGLRFAASGEILALRGFDFPPADTNAAAFVDGWEVRFSHVLVTIGAVRLQATPDLVAGDQSKTGGLVAELAGPWALDLAISDPSYIAGKGGPGELAVPFASMNGAELKTDGTRYAFGFDAVRASAAAKRVNVSGDGEAAYQRMVNAGCVVLYSGRATFKGDKSDPACFPDDRKAWPDVVDFDFCFKTPTTYVNCQNPDNAPARPLADEEDQRGIALKDDTSVIAQVTFHTDHPFWDSVLHDAPTHFDQFAARAVGRPPGPSGAPTVTLEDLLGVDYTAYTDATGKPIAWRYCVDPPTDVHAKFSGAMRFDPQTVPHAPSPDPAGGLRDYYDFASYNQSTQGHLNSDGLCFVRRSYASPP